MPEYHAILSVEADNWFDAERAFRVIEQDTNVGGARAGVHVKLTRIEGVKPDTGGEPHPRLERLNREGVDERHARLYREAYGEAREDYRGPAPDGVGFPD